MQFRDRIEGNLPFVEVSTRARIPVTYCVCWGLPQTRKATRQILKPLYNYPFGIQAPKLETRIQPEFPIRDRTYLPSNRRVGVYSLCSPTAKSFKRVLDELDAPIRSTHLQTKNPGGPSGQVHARSQEGAPSKLPKWQ